MKRIVFAAMVLAACAAGASQAPGPGPAQRPKAIHAEGCVEAGVEARCLVLRDVKSGVVYNLLIKDARPQIGTGIEFTGTPFQGVTACMEGEPVNVTAWARKDSLKCMSGQNPQR